MPIIRFIPPLNVSTEELDLGIDINDRALADYERGYRSGRYSLLHLNDAQKVLLEARLESVITAAEFHTLRLEIERLTGQAMATGAMQ